MPQKWIYSEIEEKRRIQEEAKKAARERREREKQEKERLRREKESQLREKSQRQKGSSDAGAGKEKENKIGNENKNKNNNSQNSRHNNGLINSYNNTGDRECSAGDSSGTSSSDVVDPCKYIDESSDDDDAKNGNIFKSNYNSNNSNTSKRKNKTVNLVKTTDMSNLQKPRQKVAVPPRTDCEPRAAEWDGQCRVFAERPWPCLTGETGEEEDEEEKEEVIVGGETTGGGKKTRRRVTWERNDIFRNSLMELSIPLLVNFDTLAYPSESNFV